MQHLNLLANAIKQTVALTDAELADLLQGVTHRKLARREHLLLAGEVCDVVYYIVEGCLRYYALSEKGEERTGQFFFENEWYTDYASFLQLQPSGQCIQALEPTQVLILSRKHLYEAYDRTPRLERFGRLMAEQAYLGARGRNMSLLSQTPEQRYQALIERRPQLLQRVPLHYIASFLGIEPESLSRIRKRGYEQEHGNG